MICIKNKGMILYGLCFIYIVLIFLEKYYPVLILLHLVNFLIFICFMCTNKVKDKIFIFIVFLGITLSFFWAVINGYFFLKNHESLSLNNYIIGYSSVFYFIISAPIAEELLFRELYFKIISKNHFFWYFIGSIIFTMLHIMLPYNGLEESLWKLPSLFTLSMFAYYIRRRYSLLYAIIFHMSWNIVAI